MPLTIPEYITIKTAAGAMAAYLSPEADSIKDCYMERELNGRSVLTFSLPIQKLEEIFVLTVMGVTPPLPSQASKWQYLIDSCRIYAPDITGVMREFVIQNPDAIEKTRDGGKLWGKITAHESWVRLGKDYVDPGISNDPQTPTPPALAVIILSGGSDLSGGLYPVGSAGHALYALLQGTGWTVGTVDVTGTHDLETEKISRLENINKVQEIWGGYLLFDSVAKTVSLRDETLWAPYTGYQIRYAKNLKGITRTDDYDVITKLYPFGESDLNIGSVNGGVIYLTNNTYTAEVLEGIWVNQDIADATELKAEAEKYLAKVCKPRHNYRVKQVDLRTLSGYQHEDFDLGHLVDIIDEDLGANDQARIIRYRFNIFQPWKDPELEVGDPIEKIDSMLEDSRAMVQYLNDIKTSKGQITAYKLVDESVLRQKIAKGAIDASRINAGIIILSGDTWTDNTPSAGYVSWNQHEVYWNGTEYVIAAGNVNQKYIYWDNQALSYGSSATLPTLTDAGFIIAVNNGGLHELVWNQSIAQKLVGTEMIAEFAVDTSKLAEAAVTTAKIAGLAVDTTKLADLAVVAEKIASGAVDLTTKVAGLLPNTNLAQITDATKIADGLLSASKLADGAVTNIKLAALAVDAAKLADSAVTATKIANAAVGSAAIANAAVGSAQIADLAVITAKIADLAVATGKIADAAITNAKIATLAVGTANIQDAAINSAKIANAAVGSAAIANLAVGTAHIADGAILNAKIGNAEISEAKIQDLAVSSAKVADAAITSAKIANAAVGAAAIANAVIGTAHISDAAIQTAKIADLAVTDGKIASLTANKITAGQLLAYLVEIVGKNGHFRINGDEFLVYDKTGALMGRFGHYETLADQLAAFTRASTAYDDYGNQVASGVPRYPYAPLPAPVWQDLFDTDQLAAEYESGGDAPATWAVSGGVLTGTGGTNATLVKNDLLLQDVEIEVNCDQTDAGGIIARYQDNNNYYLLALRDDGFSDPARNLQLYKRVGGGYTSLAVANVAWPRGTAKSIKFTLHGFRLEVWFDGIKVISITDTDFTGGGVGLYSGSTVVSRYLDFTVYYAQQGAQVEVGATNILLYGQQLDNAAWAQANISISANSTLAPDGATTADTLTDSNAAAVGYTTQSKAIANDSTSRTASIYIKKDTDETRFPALCLFLTGGTTIVQIAAQINTKTGATAARLSVGTVVINPVEQIGDYWKLSVTATNNSTGNISADTYVIPADGTVFGTQSAAATGSAIFWQADLINLPYPTTPIVTTSASATRNAETMTVPTTGVFVKGNWTVKLRYTPTSSPVATGVWKTLFHCVIDASNKYELDVDPAGKLYALIGSGGAWYVISDLAALTIGQSYEISFSGNGSIMRLHKNGAQVGADTAYVEPVGTLPTNMYVGSNSGDTSQANGIISDFAVLNKAETLADHQADFNSGLPLSVDEYTTYLMSCDGHLQPTVRGFGLWSKNGRYILQDPLTGQGFELWDGAVQKVLIGRQSDGTIAGKFIGCILYGSAIRSGAEGDTTYIELSSAGGDPLTVVEGGKTALNIWTSGGGLLQFYDTALDDMVGQIMPYNDSIGQGLRIQGRNNAGFVRGVNISGSSLRLDASQDIQYHATVGYNNFYGDIVQVTGTKRNMEDTADYGKRLLAVVESPEQIYTDAKKAQLNNGECKILVDPMFLQCIEPDTEDTPWLVHLTPYADVGVYVAEIGADYFIAKERNGGTSNSIFAWSLFATRKDHAFERFPEVV